MTTSAAATDTIDYVDRHMAQHGHIHPHHHYRASSNERHDCLFNSLLTVPRYSRCRIARMLTSGLGPDRKLTRRLWIPVLGVDRTVGGGFGQRGWLLCPNGSHVSLFGHLKRVVDLNAEVARGALDLGVSEQELHSAQVAGSPVDQGDFGPAQ